MRILRNMVLALLLVAAVMIGAVPGVLAAPQQGPIGPAASIPTQRGQTVTTPPVSMQEISGTQLAVTFTATASAAGTLMVTASAAGRSPNYILRAPSEGTITATMAALSATTSVAGTTKAGPLPPAVLVRVMNATGQVIAQCSPSVAASGTVTLPAVCQRAGVIVTLAPLAASVAQVPVPVLPRSLPQTGAGGTGRTVQTEAALVALFVLLVP